MPWLSNTHREVEEFHPVFEEAAVTALRLEGLDDELQWEHHLRPATSSIIPDFVLRNRADGRWRLAVEVKRSKASVYSTRFQMQAKSYADENSDLFVTGAPLYFAITNLEQTILFAQKGPLPPARCRLRDGVYPVGDFANLNEVQFKERLVSQLRSVCRRVLSENVEFDSVWPMLLDRFIQTAAALSGTGFLTEPTTSGWPVVREFFCNSTAVDAARLLVLRCLLLEYIGGVLRRFEHGQVGHLVSLRNAPAIGAEIATAITRLRAVDFQQIFDENCLPIYRAITNQRVVKRLREYVASITTDPSAVAKLAAAAQLDRNELLEGILIATHGGEVADELDERGKVTTDPELAALLATLAIAGTNGPVADPCCGNGSLLEAAYDRLRTIGSTHDEALDAILGFEADPLLARMAMLRLLLKEPANVRPDLAVRVLQADMFCQRHDLSNAAVVLMNPPFKRYEAQDRYPVPPLLKTHYADEIVDIDGEAISSTGQQNLYTYYVEYIIRAAAPGCRIAVILDNKWYHNQYAEPLRALLLQECAVEALIKYPFSGLFEKYTIATSILICRKLGKGSTHDGEVRFIRSGKDLAHFSTEAVAAAMHDGEEWPEGWTCRSVPQQTLRAETGWREHFEAALEFDFRHDLPTLPSLFEYNRRGSLGKEEGGMSPLAFPFSRSTFGKQRRRPAGSTGPLRALTPTENSSLRSAANKIPLRFQGFAVENADALQNYELSEGNVLRQPTIEPPTLRGLRVFFHHRKTPWTHDHDVGLQQLTAEATAARFIRLFRQLSGLNAAAMSDQTLWVGLREPAAGELIIPRKTRKAHRVHVNPMAWNERGKQVRLSSNFISYSRCIAVDLGTGLDRSDATRLIAAFLLSSFGQVQFEMCGYDREGLLSLEKDHLERVHVLSPRDIPQNLRTQILSAFSKLPYPIANDRLSYEQPARNELDRLFATVICQRNPSWSVDSLLNEAHLSLDDYLLTRRP